MFQFLLDIVAHTIRSYVENFLLAVVIILFGGAVLYRTNKHLFDQTPLARNILIVLVLFSLYTFFGGFTYPIVTAIVSLVVSLIVAFKFSISKNEDLDVLGAMVINNRGYYEPKGTEKPPNTQNCVAYFDKPLEWEQVRSHMISKLFNQYKYRRLESIGKIEPNGSKKAWNTQWIKCDINDPSIMNQLLQYHKVTNNDELYELIEQLCNMVLPRYLPQWRVHYIENNNGLSCWLWRVSHGIADGLRLVSLATDFFQDIDGNPCKVPSMGKLQSSKRKIKVKPDDIILKTAQDAKLFYENSYGYVKKQSKIKNDEIKDRKDKASKKKGKKKSRSMIFQFLTPKFVLNIFKDFKAVNDMMNGKFDSISPFKPDYTVHCPQTQQIVRPSSAGSNISVTTNNKKSSPDDNNDDSENKEKEDTDSKASELDETTKEAKETKQGGISKGLGSFNNETDYIPLDYVKTIKNHYKVSVNDVLTALFAGAVRNYILYHKGDFFTKATMVKHRVELFF